jgi:tumor protein p53-inducible protein 3
MKAILFDQPGGPEVLYLGEAPQPTPSVDELLVQVHATAVNRAEVLQRQGKYPPPPGASPILGLELAGEVVVGAGAWRPGDRIMAVVTGGGYAEYATVPAGMALRIPDAFTYEQAAAIPEAYLTAYLNLFELGRLQRGETVLIHAGASGVGSAAIQLAKSGGARIFTTASSAEKREFCRSIGAELAIDYRAESFVDAILAATDGRGVDVIIDFIGAPYWSDNLKALAAGGRLLLVGFLGGASGDLNLAPVLMKRLTVRGATLRGMPLAEKISLNQAFAAYALPLFEDDLLRPVIDRVLPLNQAAEAHRLMEANANIGKIVLRVS